MNDIFSFRLLLRRRALSLSNTFKFFTAYQWARNGAFLCAGLSLLAGLHVGFFRLLSYLHAIPVMGPLLIWKLTAMLLLTTLSMTMISSLLTSLTTLYYSFDMKFLLKAPLSLRAIFLDKSLESLFFSSWMIGLILFPFIAALMRVNGYGFDFFAVFFFLLIPYLALAASFGIAFTLLVLYFFPSSRTRDVIYIFSSFSLTLVYGLIRFAEPERLIRPDALHVVAEYLSFLQAPTAPALPSWWLTKALSCYAGGKMGPFFGYSGLLIACALSMYAALVALAGRIYYAGYSGAQDSPMRRLPFDGGVLPEVRLARRFFYEGAIAPLFWKERKSFFRDVKHWSQIFLVCGLIFVYLFSIQRLPLDTAELKSLISFLNIGVASSVLAALGLRFTFPSISMEGRSWWVIGSAPVALSSVMKQKFLFSAVPMLTMALVLGLVTNFLLGADAFTSYFSLGALLTITTALVSMGIGFGALFPMFNVENIHQVESSLGGFVYMAASLGYIGLSIMILSWPVRMHFAERFGQVGAWNWDVVWICAAAFALLNAAALIIPWTMGRRALENYEN